MNTTPEIRDESRQQWECVWQPMETAPKDGTLILLACRVPEIGRWYDDRHSSRPRPYWCRYSIFGTRKERQDQPTAWMHLPPVPNAQKE